MKKKYRLNPIYSLGTMDEITVLPEYRDELKNNPYDYILMNTNKGNVYLINSTIYHFLLHFKNPQSVEEFFTANNISKKDRDTVKNGIDIFTHQMLNKKILLAEDEDFIPNQKISKYTIQDSLYDYTIVELVANKSSVDIYKALNSGNNWVAIKLVHPAKFTSERRFQKAKISLHQEFQFLKKLDSIPEVVNVYNYVETEEEALMVMEYIEGENMGKFIQSENRNHTLNEKLQIISQILDIFSRVHALGILHGDIHASNFIITEGKVRVIDFGLGQHSQPKENELIRYGGMLYYMPPERIQATVFSKFVNPSNLQSEVYQLGILTYFILYNTTPFKALTWKNLAHQILNSDVEFAPWDAPSSFNTSLQKIIRKALDKNPKKRFKSAREFYEKWNDWVTSDVSVHQDF